MSLGGNILNNAQSRSPSTEFSRDSGGNGIFGDVRPQLKSVSNFDGYDRYDKYGASNSEYGGGLLGTGSQSKPRSIIDTLMGSFLGKIISSLNNLRLIRIISKWISIIFVFNLFYISSHV
jgi:hypothetical protein